MNNIYVYAAIVAVLLTMTLIGLFLYDLYKNRNAPPHPKNMQEGIRAIFNESFNGFHAMKLAQEITVGSCVKAQNFDKPLHVVHIHGDGFATMVFDLESPHPQVLIQQHVSKLKLIEGGA